MKYNISSRIIHNLNPRNKLTLQINTLHYIYSLIPWRRLTLWRLRVSQLIKIFPPFCGTQRFITQFIRARYFA